MPSKWTFQVKPLLTIIHNYMKDNELWIDPFSGFNSPATITNDLNPDAPTIYHLDALAFMIEIMESGNPVDGVIFDPPYSLTQVSRSYNDIGLTTKGRDNPTGGFPRVKDCIADVTKLGGHVISYGWNSGGMGKKRGFELIECLICCHGGTRNDTIVVVERRC